MKINNVIVRDPAVNGLSVSYEPIWSKNAGRSPTTGKAIGDLIGEKVKLTIKWPPLTAQEFATISQALRSKAFFPVEYIDPDADKTEIKMFYAGPRSVFAYSYTVNKRYHGATVSLIEQ